MAVGSVFRPTSGLATASYAGHDFTRTGDSSCRARCDSPDMTRRLTVGLIVLALLFGTGPLALTAQNEGCLPWQERVGYGDGPLGEQQDYSACR
jgi:hypothetical protein